MPSRSRSLSILARAARSLGARSLGVRARRAAMAAALLAPIGLNTSCVGQFPLTKAAYRFNLAASPNEFVQTLVFWGFNIIPVYGVAVFVDVFVLNAIEFWSGETVQLGDKRSHAAADGPQAIRLAGRDANGREVFLTLAPSPTSSDVYVAYAEDGSTLGRVERDANGDALIYTADGKLAKRLPSIATR